MIKNYIRKMRKFSIEVENKDKIFNHRKIIGEGLIFENEVVMLNWFVGGPRGIYSNISDMIIDLKLKGKVTIYIL